MTQTLKEQETQDILKLIHQLADLQKQLDAARDRIRELETQVFGGSTK